MHRAETNQPAHWRVPSFIPQTVCKGELKSKPCPQALLVCSTVIVTKGLSTYGLFRSEARGVEGLLAQLGGCHKAWLGACRTSANRATLQVVKGLGSVELAASRSMCKLLLFPSAIRYVDCRVWHGAAPQRHGPPAGCWRDQGLPEQPGGAPAHTQVCAGTAGMFFALSAPLKRTACTGLDGMDGCRPRLSDKGWVQCVRRPPTSCICTSLIAQPWPCPCRLADAWVAAADNLDAVPGLLGELPLANLSALRVLADTCYRVAAQFNLTGGSSCGCPSFHHQG